MAQQSTVIKTQKLFRRTVSAMMLLAIAGLAIWLGGLVLNSFLFLLSSLLLWEWFSLVSVFKKLVRLFLSTITSFSVVIAGSVLEIELQVALIGCVLLSGLVVASWKHGRFGFVVGSGPALIVATMMAAIYLRKLPELGLETICWLVLIVSAMDIGGYFFGKTIGGPRLAPNISPNKTYSGLLGGMLAGGIVSTVVAHLLGNAEIFSFLAIGAGLAFVSQAGDLLESSWKRYFNVKDSSSLLPGHGGFLDRFDGYLTALPIVALITFILGRSPFLWP